jgi:hypothetical protein
MRCARAAQLIAAGLTLCAMTIGAGTREADAFTQRPKAKPTAKITQYASEPSVRLRYYGGPKSPMYP